MGGPDEEGMITSSISALNYDIIRTHILTRLDGQSLAAISCVSSQFRSASTDDADLWRRICDSAWPSLNHPRLRDLVSQFPSGHRSFFSDSFPLLLHNKRQAKSTVRTESLISAVDLFQGDEILLSVVHEMDTLSTSLLSSPFKVELPVTGVSLGSRISSSGDKTWTESLKLSWIIIDPMRKRAVNVSSRRPVSLHRDWFTGEVFLRYSTVTDGVELAVEFAVEMRCEGKGGDAYVEELKLEVKDLEGRRVSGKEGVMVIGEVMEMERGRMGKDVDKEMRERYDAFVRQRTERRERMLRRDQAVDAICAALDLAFVVVSLLVVLSLFVTYLSG